MQKLKAIKIFWMCMLIVCLSINAVTLYILSTNVFSPPGKKKRVLVLGCGIVGLGSVHGASAWNTWRCFNRMKRQVSVVIQDEEREETQPLMNWEEKSDLYNVVKAKILESDRLSVLKKHGSVDAFTISRDDAYEIISLFHLESNQAEAYSLLAPRIVSEGSRETH